MKPAMTAQQKEFTNSSFSTYKKLVVGDGASVLHFWIYEILNVLLCNLPGIFGLGLRMIFTSKLLRSCGRKIAIGRSVLIRRPRQIGIGKNVLLDDFSVLDVRGDEGSIEIGDFVSLGRGSQIVSKDAEVIIGNGVNIGSNSRIASQSKILIEESVLISAYCYIGPGNHQFGDSDAPLIEQEMEIKDGVKIGKNAWIGARATILDGVVIGEGAIVGAHSLVRENVPAYTIVAGTPAKVLGTVPVKA